MWKTGIEIRIAGPGIIWNPLLSNALFLHRSKYMMNDEFFEIPAADFGDVDNSIVIGLGIYEWPRPTSCTAFLKLGADTAILNTHERYLPSK